MQEKYGHMQLFHATPLSLRRVHPELSEAAAVCQTQIDIMRDGGLTMHISKECTCAWRFSQDSFST